MNLSELAIAGAAGVTLVIFNLLLYFLQDFIRSKAGAEKLQLISGYALQGVMQVEQLWRSGQIQKDSRYQAAEAFIRAKFPNLSDGEIEGYIEAAVAEVKVQLGEWLKPVTGDPE